MSTAFQSTPVPTDGLQPAVAKRMLVVDDSKLQRKLVVAQVKKWGYEIFEADSGQTAMEICKSTNIDFIISDWMMPNMSGIEFCEEFRKLGRSSYGYFILLTSKTDKADIAQGLDVGADDFLSKPVNATELRSRLRAGQRILNMEQAVKAQHTKTEAALQEVEHLYQEIQKDLKEAEKLQLSLIPESNVTIDVATISNIFKSSGHVGGDLLGYFKISETRIGIYSIDVSGHGVSSALLTIRLAGYFSPENKEQNLAFAKTDDGQYRIRTPAEIATCLNQQMLQELDTELYMTMAYADINLTTGECQMVQAGHPHPVRFNPKTGVEILGTGGPPIGMLNGLVYENFDVQLRPNDKLLLYTDGLTECENPKGDLLDDEGLEDILLRHSKSNGEELLNDILWELTQYASGDMFGDDVSAVLMEYRQT